VTLSADESLAARYLAAVEKMQPPTHGGGRRRQGRTV
jgi:hypothetical protein